MVGDTVLELQRKINILEIFCEKWGMEVNLKKTKVVVFRKGGKTSKSERFFYRNRSVEIVTYYRYLGLIFSSRTAWSKALSTLASQVQKALSIVRRMIWRVGHPKLHVSFKIFDSRIAPILCYGSEIWGHTYQDQIEKIHVSFCKFVLGVSKTASNSAVLGECGRLPLSIHYQKRYVKFWLKLLKSDEGFLLHASYQTQIHLDKTYTKGWVTDLKRLLFSNGFGHVWISDGVGDENKLLHEFSLRLADTAKQNWKSDTDANAKLSTYREIKSLLEPEKYLKEIDNYFIRRQTVKFRISDHSLMIEKGRHHGMLREDRICKQCDIGCVEDEFHFFAYLS